MSRREKPEFSHFWESILSMRDISGGGGDPVAGEQAGGKPEPLERERGKNSPPANLKRVTARAWAQRGKRFPFETQKNHWKSKGCKKQR
jgi:hypothetical protein